MFTLTFETDGAVFDDDPSAEIVTILRNIANLEERNNASPNHKHGIYDSNGNKIGHWLYVDDD